MRPVKAKPILALLAALALGAFLAPPAAGAGGEDERFQAALEAFIAGRNEQAAGFLADILRESPDYEPALRLLGFLAPAEKSLVPEELPRLAALELREADLRGALRLFAREYGFNLALGPSVSGSVTASFRDVPAREALEIMLKTNGFGYEEQNGVIFVDTLANIAARREARISEVEENLRRQTAWQQQFDEARDARDAREEAGLAVETEVFNLAHANAEEIIDAVSGVLSARGTAYTLFQTVPGGWEMGGISGGSGGSSSGLGRKTRVDTEQEELPTVLVVNDTPPFLARARTLVERLDIAPAQVLIEAMIVEVSSDNMRDLGIEWGANWQQPDLAVARTWSAGIGWVSDALTAGYSYAKGNRAVYAKISALEQEGKARILSQPRVVALHNQEAVIMVGERYPIMTTETRVATDGSTYITGSLDRYEPIGISLRVIPRVTRAGHVTLLVHPEVTSKGEDVSAGSGDGRLELPRINTREADTRVTVRDGEMVVIGGLLEEQESNTVYKTPLLGDIPLLGALFRRTKKETRQMDLLILITPRIMDDTQLSALSGEERRRMETE